MKIKLLHFIVFFLAVSCAAPKFYYQRVNNIPTKAPNFDVDIYWTGDSVPEKPYFEIVDIHMAEKGMLDKKTIMKKLEFEAIKEGVDAVIDVEHWNEKEKTTNALTIFVDMFDEDGETTYVNANFTHIRGIGIKYLENIDYVHELPEFEYVYSINQETGFPTPFLKFEYTLTGQEHMVFPEVDGALEIYKKYFQYYSDYHLLQQREGWAYVKKQNQVTGRRLVNEDGYTIKRCIPEYDGQGKIIVLTIVHVSDGIKGTEKVIYHYDEKGKRFGRTVMTHEKVKIFEQDVYDAEKLIGRKIKITIPGEENLLFNTSIVYYNANYLERYYKEEYAAKQQGHTRH